VALYGQKIGRTQSAAMSRSHYESAMKPIQYLGRALANPQRQRKHDNVGVALDIVIRRYASSSVHPLDCGRRPRTVDDRRLRPTSAGEQPATQSTSARSQQRMPPLINAR
jgi:hypothetical protein